MTSRRTVCAAIDEADVGFQKCRNVLTDIKEGRLDDEWRQRFANFQQDLARALFKLDRVYRGLASEKGVAISRKRRIRADRFNRRMQKLGEYQEVITDAIRMGKALGDAFAWLFDQREQRFIAKHLQHQGNLHTPPGIGGIGELEFTKRFKFLDNHVVIYHGTSNFLRIGDVSFIHLPTLLVSAIGELKTKRVGDTTIETTLMLISDRDVRKRMPSIRRAPRLAKEASTNACCSRAAIPSSDQEDERCLRCRRRPNCSSSPDDEDFMSSHRFSVAFR